jgi:hypothetical protein
MPGNKKNPEDADSSQLDLWSANQEFQWEDFKVAREYIQSLGLLNHAGWVTFVKDGNLKSLKIPEDPDKVYQHLGWNGWYDWLGIDEPENNEEITLNQLFNKGEKNGLWSTGQGSKWLNFHEARKIVREFGFEYEEEWGLFVDGKFPNRGALPDNIPKNPDQVYRFVGWGNWTDWLVHPEKQTHYTSFYKAREFVRSCRIPDKGFWRDFLQQKAGLIEKYHLVLPVRPHLEYRDSGWSSWEDWLGTEISYHDFTSTRRFVHSLNLLNQKAWMDFCHGRLTHKAIKKENVDTYPEIAFRDTGWKGWEDWLGASKERDPEPAPSASTEIFIDCKCKGRIKNCPECEGKGYYSVQLR